MKNHFGKVVCLITMLFVETTILVMCAYYGAGIQNSYISIIVGNNKYLDKYITGNKCVDTISPLAMIL